MSLLLLLWPLWLIRKPEAQSPIWARRSLILLISLLTVRYLYWRCTSSLNLDTPVSTALSLTLLTAESWLLISGLLPLWLAWRRFPDRRREAETLQRQWEASGWNPKVDIFVPTCGEPLDVLERSLQGCREQSYSNVTVWVLDDKGRDEVRRLARALGCRYRHRPERANAKAGNLNDGLRISDGELVAVFDADFIPQHDFLKRTIGFLMKPDVGMVQTPQHYLNADPVMRNLGMERWMLPDEESFYRWIEPVRDGWEAVVCAGTSFLVRRRALDQVGGFVEQALSEDFVTGIALREQGWRLVYLQQKLSAGLAAERMVDFVRQRQRWASGTLQSLHLPQGPLRARGLGLGQRLAYLEGAIHWINHLPRLVLMLMPFSIGLFGVLPIRLDADAVLNLLLPLWGSVLLSIGWLNRRSRAALLSELTGWVLTVPLTITLFWRQRGFRTTPKHQPRLHNGWDWSLAVPLMLLCGLNALNLAALLLQISADIALTDTEKGLGLIWACLNLLGTTVALRACWDPSSDNPAPWFCVDQPAELIDAGGHRNHCRIRAISEVGAEIIPHTKGGEVVKGSQLRWEGEPLALDIRHVASSRDNKTIAVQWQNLSSHQKRCLQRWLYQRNRCWVDREPPPEWKSLTILLQRTVMGSKTPGTLQRSLTPLSSSENGNLPE